MFQGPTSARRSWRGRKSATTFAVLAGGGLLLLSGAALIASETTIAVQSVAVTKILIPQDQPVSGTLEPKPLATPYDVAVDDVRALFVTSNARPGAGGMTIFQQGTNVALAQTNVDQVGLCLPVALPAGGSMCAPDLLQGNTRNPLGLTLNPGTTIETGTETASEGTGAEVAPPVMIYQVLQHSGLKWNAGRTGFDTLSAPDDPAEASLLLEYDITDPQNPVLKNGFVLGHGAQQAAVNSGTGLVFAGNTESAPFISAINPLYAAGTNPYLFIDLPAGDAVAGVGLPAAGAEAGGSAFAVTHTSGKIYAFDAGCAASGTTCIQYSLNVNPLFPEGAPHMNNVAVGTVALYATVNAIGDAALPDDAPSLTQGQSIVQMLMPAEEATVDPATVPLARFDLPNVNAHAAAVDDTRNLLYVTGERTGNVGVVDATTGALRQVIPISIALPTCTAPAGVTPNVQGVQVDPTGGNAYVADAGATCLYESVTVLSPDANEPIRIASFSTNLSAPQDTGASIDLSAFATGGAGAYEYKFFAFDGTTWTIIRDWNTASTFTWTATNASRIGVWARAVGSPDAPGSADAAASMDFAIGMHAPLTITDIAHNPIHPQTAGTPITLTAVTANANGTVEYKWWEYDGAAWTVPVGGDWSPNSTFVWTPGSANPNYRVGVWARFAASDAADAPDNPQAVFSTEFPIAAGQTAPIVVSALTANLNAPQAMGTPITFTVTSNLAAEYKFWLFDGATWTAAPAGWSTSNTFVWTPTAENPNARVGVWARTPGSGNDAPDDPTLATASMAFPIGNGLTVTTILSDTRLPTHSNVTITFTTATSNAAGPLQYKYWLYDGQAWYVVQDWSTNASYAWTPSTANLNYRIGVWVRTVGNTTDAPETETSLYSMGAPIQAGGL